MLPLVSRLVSLLLPLLLSLIVCGLIIALSGGDPAEALAALAVGAFGSAEGIASTLMKATPLMLVGLGVAFGLRAGLFNIGGEGQLYVGGIAAAAVGAWLGLPWLFHLPLTLLAGACAGGVWGAIPGWLKARRGVHEVINTIMLNYIAIHLADYLVNGPMAAGAAVSQTRPIAATATLPLLWSVPPAGVGYGLLIAMALCGLFYVILFDTPFGYEARAVGHNPEASRGGGIDVGRVTVRALALSGALAGLAGAVEVCGVHRTLYAQFSPGYGFDGIAVALLARNHPLGVIPAALLFGGLRTADRFLQLSAGVPRDLVVILQALIILFVGAEYVSKTAIQKILRGRQPSPTP
ncbi:MAG: ABC transporter permease [Candidatus Latescibacteria bacterium]|nr:ABC transporter permease [Candidatus Latescibacterota bacterium]